MLFLLTILYFQLSRNNRVHLSILLFSGFLFLFVFDSFQFTNAENFDSENRKLLAYSNMSEFTVNYHPNYHPNWKIDENLDEKFVKFTINDSSNELATAISKVNDQTAYVTSIICVS